jgi:hypothetical protein
MLSIQTSNAAPANIASCLSISNLRDELAGKAYARIFTRAVIYHLGFDVFAKRFDSAPIAWTRSYTRRLRLNGGALKSTSECGSSNINQSLKKTSVTQAHLEFQLWQIDSRIMAPSTRGGWTAPLAATFQAAGSRGARISESGARKRHLATMPRIVVFAGRRHDLGPQLGNTKALVAKHRGYRAVFSD